MSFKNHIFKWTRACLFTKEKSLRGKVPESENENLMKQYFGQRDARQMEIWEMGGSRM